MKEKTADEMFDDEGMWLDYEDNYDMVRINDYDKTIRIRKLTREIECHNRFYDNVTITFNELLAIYKYYEEQGWLDD